MPRVLARRLVPARRVVLLWAPSICRCPNRLARFLGGGSVLAKLGHLGGCGCFLGAPMAATLWASLLPNGLPVDVDPPRTAHILVG